MFASFSSRLLCDCCVSVALGVNLFLQLFGFQISSQLTQSNNFAFQPIREFGIISLSSNAPRIPRGFFISTQFLGDTMFSRAVDRSAVARGSVRVPYALLGDRLPARAHEPNK